MTKSGFLFRLARVLRALWKSDGRQIIYYCNRIGLGSSVGYPLTKAIRLARFPMAYVGRRAATSVGPKLKTIPEMLKSCYGS